MKKEIKGVITALITPFIESEIDEAGFVKNIRFQLENNIDGLLILGTTGEHPTLTDKEQEILTALAKKEIAGKVPLIVNTGVNCTKKTIEKTRLAKERGADAALIVTPYYNKPTQEGIFRHFQAIADAVDIPLIIYNHPGRAGVNIELATIDRIAKIPNIIGIKEASSNLHQIEEITRYIPSLPVFCGCDELNFSALCLGSLGVISVASNLVPAQIKYLTKEALQGNMRNARNAHYYLLSLFNILTLETNPIPIKHAMKLCQMPSGPCRLPLCELPLSPKQRIYEILDKMELMVGVR